MTALEKRLARSNARYALPSRIDRLRASGRGQGLSSMIPSHGRRSSPHNDESARSLWLQFLQAHDLMLREVRRGFQDAATLPQFDVLVHLDGATDGLTLADLSRRLLVTPGNLTGIVGRLERDRLVRREGDPFDGRAFRVRLTLRGRNHVRRLAPRYARLVTDLLGGLSLHDQIALHGLLQRLREDLEKRGPR